MSRPWRRFPNNDREFLFRYSPCVLLLVAALIAVCQSGCAGFVTTTTTQSALNSSAVVVKVTPASTTVKLGTTDQFVGSVTGTSNDAVTWSVSGAGCAGAACGTVSQNGLYTPPARVPSPGIVTVRATSVADPMKSASASITVVAALTVALGISPTNASVDTAGTQTFKASVSGSSNSAVKWSVTGAGCSGSRCGTVSTSGSSAVYSAPSVAPSPATVKVTATNVADPSESASASVSIVPVVVVTVSPDSASVATGTSEQFDATVTGTSNGSVAWSVAGTGCSGSACGTISGGGLYTAPAVVPTSGTVIVKATSMANASVSDTTRLTIFAPVKAATLLPTLPKASVDVTMPVQTGTVRNVGAGNASALQSAINAASCGDTIVLAAGSTYTGNFTIPNKNCSGWILIQSSGLASLPAPGTRVSGACNGTYPTTVCPSPTPGTIAKMATLVSATANRPTIAFQTAAHNWRLIGLEITQTAGLHDFALIETDNSVTSAANLVNHLIIDRCYIHGTASGAVRRGVSFQVANGAVIDSDIREIHDQAASPGLGSDSQAIAVWSGTGPFLYRNNFLSAASENTMFGGSDPSISGLVPSDITIVGNHYWKDYTSWHAKSYDVKNLFELKNAQRVLVDGNVFDTVWADAQQGTAIVFTVRNQGGGCNWCVVQDVTFTHNLVEHAVTGLETTGSDDANVSLPDNRVLVQNDIFTDVQTGFYLDSAPGVANLKSDNITIDHDDVFNAASILISGDTGQVTTLAFTNVIGLEGSYTFGGAGTYGLPALTFSTFVKSLSYGNNLVLTPNGVSDGKKYPAGKTFFNSTGGARFMDFAGGNYQLTPSSPYHNAGSDGKDIGVWDWTTFNRATTGALDGTYPQ